MKRPRDSQKSKLYRAEQVAFPGPAEFKSLDECETFLNSFQHKPWYLDLLGRNGRNKVFVTFADGRGRRTPCATRDGKIKLPRWARTRIVILHELAHLITARHYAAHGRQFAWNFIQLVKGALGGDDAVRLINAFNNNRVRWNVI